MSISQQENIVLFLWLVSQTGQRRSVHSWEKIVVCAPSEEAARKTHPDPSVSWVNGLNAWTQEFDAWPRHWTEVSAKCIGVALLDLKPGVICASE